MGGKAWRTTPFERGEGNGDGREGSEGRWRTRARSSPTAPGAGGPGAWGNAGGRRWVSKSDDAQLLRSMAAEAPSQPLRGSGRRWVAPVDYSEPDAHRKQSA